MKAFGKKYGVLFAAPVLIVVLLLFVFAVKGIYPFGGKTIAYYDMAQSFVPLYYHAYDILHGDKSLFFDWYSGLGKNTASLAGMFVLSPLNVFFYFIKRDMILESMSLFLILKMSLAAFSMSFYLHKSYKALDRFWIVLFALLYSCSGYVLQYYTNIYFLEIVILFPVLMYFLEKMYRENRRLGYILCYAACVVLNLYFAFMISLFILFSGFLHIRFLTEKEKRKSCYANLVYGTGMGLLISAAFFIPNVMQMLQTGRLGGQSGGYPAIASRFFTALWGQKLFMLYGCELALAVLFLFAIKKKIRNRAFRYHAGCLVLLLTPVFVESVNALWHMGSYTEFPYRFGYMLCFVCCNGAAFYISEYKEDLLHISRIALPLGKAVTILFCLGAAASLVWLLKEFSAYGIINLDAYVRYIVVFLLLFASFAGILLFFKRGRKGMLFGMVILQIVSGMYWLIEEKEAIRVEQSLSIVSDAGEIGKAFPPEQDAVSRMRAPEVNVNYGFIAKTPTLGNWSDASNVRMEKEFAYFGYTYSGDNRLMETGGTVFSDAFLHVGKIASKIERNEELYKKIGETGHFYLYENRFTLPFGIRIEKDILDEERFSEENNFDYTNALYASISEDGEPLVKTVDMENYIKGKELNEASGLYAYTVEIPIEEKEILYIEDEEVKETTGNYRFYYFFQREDGEDVPVPSMANAENIQYPFWFYSGYLELGVFEKGTASIRIETNAEELDKLNLGRMSYGKMRKLCDEHAGKGVRNLQVGKAGMSFDTQEGENGLIFLPVEYSKGWQASDGKKDVKIRPVLHGAFMALEAEPGQAHIDMKFTPPGFRPGICISIAGMLLLFLCTFLKWDAKLVRLGVLQKAAKGLFYAAAAVAAVVFYICPLILTCVNAIASCI